MRASACVTVSHAVGFTDSEEEADGGGFNFLSALPCICMLSHAVGFTDSEGEADGGGLGGGVGDAVLRWCAVDLWIFSAVHHLFVDGGGPHDYDCMAAAVPVLVCPSPATPLPVRLQASPRSAASPAAPAAAGAEQTCQPAAPAPLRRM